MILGGVSGDVSIDKLRDVVMPRHASRLYTGSLFDAKSGRVVTRDVAMGIPAFWAGAMLLAKTAGTLPLETLDTADGNKPVLAAGTAKRLRYAPNAFTNGSVFWSDAFLELITTGNFIAIKLPASDGLYANELFPIPTECVQIYRDENRELRYDIYTKNSGTFAQSVHGRHVFHARGPALDNPMMGASPIAFHANSLGIALAAQEYQGAMYRHGGVPKGVLSIDEVLDLEQAQIIGDQWNAAYGGLENAGKIAVLDRGARFEATAQKNTDAQFVEQLQLSDTDCARILNLPPALIGAQGASLTYANAQHNDMHFLKFSLRPWLDYMESALNMDVSFFGVSSPWIPRFNTDEITRPDQDSRYANYASAIAAGWMLPDEPRALEGLPARKLTPQPAIDAAAASATDGTQSDAQRSLDRSVEEPATPLVVNVGSPIVNVPDQPAPIVNMPEQPAPVVNFTAPETRAAEPANVIVNVPEQPAPVVNVEAPNVQVDVAAPSVTVAAPDVRVEPNVIVEPAKASGKAVKFSRDNRGNITGATVEEV